MTTSHDARTAETRDSYRHSLFIPTRWQDQDIYGHVNNVVYYAYFDTVIAEYLVSAGGFNPHVDQTIGVCVESQCQFNRELLFPESVEACLRLGKLGRSSVRYEIGLFKQGLETAAASGYFVHVFVDRETRKPAPVPDPLRAALAKLINEREP